MHVSVKGGTNAGWKRPLRAAMKVAHWVCPGCQATNRSFWTRCPACNHPRPEDA